MKITLQDFNEQSQQIQNAKYRIQEIDDTFKNYWIHTGAISNNLKYIMAGGSDKLLKIWNYKTNNLIKSLKFENDVRICRFTDDSLLLYVGINTMLYLLDVHNKFKKISKHNIHGYNISNIFCITNTIILTSSLSAIIKTDINKKEQLLKVQTRLEDVYGLDYNKHLNIIAIGSDDNSIKLLSGQDGTLIIDHQYEHTYIIYYVLFIVKNDQLISLDQDNNLRIWQIDYETKKLEQLQLIDDSGQNISLVLQQQYIIATGERFIKVYTITGVFVRKFDHQVDNFRFFNTIQNDSMKAVLIKGNFKLQVCQVEID